MHVKDWARSHPGITGVVAVVLGMALVGGLLPNDEAELRAELRNVRTAMAEARDENDRLEEALTEARQTESELLAEIDGVVETYEEASDELDVRDSKLDKRERQLDDREASIDEEEERIANATIRDGIWKSGVDFESGTYRAPGGGGCYWALLSAADTSLSSIINNGGFSANQTLTIDSPWFETNGCGEWKKIG